MPKKSAPAKRAETVIKTSLLRKGRLPEKSDPDGFPETVLKLWKNNLLRERETVGETNGTLGPPPDP